MKKNKSVLNKTYAQLVLGVTLLVSISGCGGSGAGNPLIDLSYESYSSLAQKDPLQILYPILGIRPAFATVNSVTLCFKRIRLSLSSGSSGGNLDFEPGSVTLSPSGTSIGSVQIPTGSYDRLEFDLEEGCGIGASIDLVVDAVPYTTTDTISIRFDGDFTITEDSDAINMSIQALIDQLDTVTANNEIKTKAESVSGGINSN